MTEFVSEPILDFAADCGEGPVWVESLSALAWVDATRPALHLFSPEERTDRVIPLKQIVGSVVIPEGRPELLLLAAQGGLFSITLADGEMHPLLPIETGRPDALLNDSRCDASGNLWAGVTTLGETPGAGSLMRITPDLRATLALVGMTTPNGMDWSPDGSVFYLVDSPTRRIDAYAYDAERGSLGEHRTFAVFDPRDGFPDGLTVDAEGFVWVAHWGGAKVSRLDPAGHVERSIALPVTRVSSCGFGGADLQDLYITTASKEFGSSDPPDERYGGTLFRVRLDTPGQQVRRFRLPA